MSGLAEYVLHHAEEYCGLELTKMAASLLVVSSDGLTEVEMLVMLASAGLNINESSTRNLTRG
jgi:hypothetical protein